MPKTKVRDIDVVVDALEYIGVKYHLKDNQITLIKGGGSQYYEFAFDRKGNYIKKGCGK